jgi:serine/threonine protein kinase
MHLELGHAQISRLEFMHSRGVLHRDVQLGNCVIGLEPRHETIYMIDFGFAKRYLDHKQKHIANRTERSFIGNYWFSSVNVHCRGKSTYAVSSSGFTLIFKERIFLVFPPGDECSMLKTR